MRDRAPDRSHYGGPAASSGIARQGARAVADTFTLVLRGDAPSGPVVALSNRRVTRIGKNTAVAALVAIGAVSAMVRDISDDRGSGFGDSSGSTAEPRTLDELDAEHEREQNVLDALDADFECSEPGGDGMRDTSGCIVLPGRVRAICPDTVSDEARGRALKESDSDVAPIAPAPYAHL